MSREQQAVIARLESLQRSLQPLRGAKRDVEPPDPFPQMSRTAEMLYMGALPRSLKMSSQPRQSATQERLELQALEAPRHVKPKGVHPFTLIPTMSSASADNMGGIRDVEALIGSDLQNTSHRMVDIAAQREFRQQVPFYKPTAWHVPCVSISVDDIPSPYGVWDYDSHRDGDRSLLVPTAEWHSSTFEPIQELLEHQAQSRLTRSGKVLLGEEEEEMFRANEVLSLVPVRSFHHLMSNLNAVLDPLPPPLKNKMSEIEKQLYTAPRPRRPLRLYPLLLADHPIYRAVTAPVVDSDGRERLSILRQSAYDVGFEEVLICHQDDGTEEKKKTGDKVEIGIQGPEVAKGVKSRDPSRITVTLHHPKPKKPEWTEEEKRRRDRVKQCRSHQMNWELRQSRKQCPRLTRQRDWRLKPHLPQYNLNDPEEEAKRMEERNKAAQLRAEREEVAWRVEEWRTEMHRRLLEPLELNRNISRQAPGLRIA